MHLHISNTANEFLDTNIYELLPTGDTRQARIIRFFQELNALLPPETPEFSTPVTRDEEGNWVGSEAYSSDNSISYAQDNPSLSSIDEENAFIHRIKGGSVPANSTNSTRTIDDQIMINHATAVKKAAEKSLVFFDLPYNRDFSESNTIKRVLSVMKKTSCDGVKIEGNTELEDVIKYLDEFPDTEGYPEKKLKELYSIPMRSISQLNKNFEVLAKGMLTVATVEGDYETPPADLDPAPVPQIQQQKEPETQYSTTKTTKDNDDIDLEESQAPSFWSSIFGPGASLTTSSSSPSKETIEQDPDTDSEESEVCENIDDSVKEILSETNNIRVPTKSENLSDTTCNEYKDYEKKIQDIKGNITYNSCNPSLKGKLTRRQNIISGIIATHCDNTTRRSSRFRGGGSHTHNQSYSKTLKNRRWYMKKAKKHVKGKRKYPSRL